MKKGLLLLSAVLLGILATAQIEHGGEPHSWKMKSTEGTINSLAMPIIDFELAKAQDEVTDQYKETIYRFGIDHEVDINFFEEATATQLKGEEYLWRLSLECPDALSINFLADDFFIPEGGKLYVYSPQTKEKKGAFTAENNRPNRIFPVGLIAGSEIVIEYRGRLNDNAALHISQVTHGYRSIMGIKELNKGPFGSSGQCNINVNCPEGLPWAEQKRTVGIIVQGGGVCSGSLVNNVNQDETPLFLTANHCLGNPANWNYYFNHESGGCTGSTGPTNQSVSGGSLLASNSGSDFALIELNSNVPASFEPCFAGFDGSDALTPSSAVGIHHPGGDVKKICFENNAPFHQTISFNGNSNTAMWYINQWEDGVTEPGSSGSPLFDQNGRVIGVLSGGAAACSGTVNNGQYDFYGRLGIAWDGSSANNRLKDHLDPGNSGIEIMDTYCPYDVVFANDAAGQGITNVPELLCDLSSFTPSFTLRNQGSNTLTSATISYSYNGSPQTPINWTGNLAQNQTTDVPLSSFSPTGGTNSIIVTVSLPNGTTDENEDNDVSSVSIDSSNDADDQWTVAITTDNYGYETYWEIRELDGATVASGGNPLVGINGGGAQDATDTDPGAYEDNSDYSEVVSLPSNGCFEFVIVDDYGDGICCNFGTGSFSVTDGSGSTIASGGDFDNDVSAVRSVTYTSLDEVNITEFSVYPNPTSDYLNLVLNHAIGDYQVEILNNLGQSVFAKHYKGEQSIQLDLNALATGSYTIHVRNETESGVQRITVK